MTRVRAVSAEEQKLICVQHAPVVVQGCARKAREQSDHHMSGAQMPRALGMKKVTTSRGHFIPLHLLEATRPDRICHCSVEI
jgi:hypothetical protein